MARVAFLRFLPKLKTLSLESFESYFFYSRWAEFKKEKHTELTGLEPAASCVTGRHSNQLSYSS